MGGSLYYGLPSRASQLSNEASLHRGFTAGLHMSHVVNAYEPCCISIH